MTTDVGRAPPPLALYVHLPWCVRKCPYCDFNSHPLGGGTPFESYVQQLLADLDQELEIPAARRPLHSIFIGGGTPSLFPGDCIAALLAGVRARMALAQDAEITLEANPVTADTGRFTAYREAGVNRLSIGAQSLSAGALRRLGRIHDPHDVHRAVSMARAGGFDNLNLDLMFALPGQDLAAARVDLERLLDLAPEHISYYQLTLEPGTAFQASPPDLPDDELTAEIGLQGLEHLAAAGYAHYEVSAHARPGRACRHNMNYWRFGDYLGIGAGAHGKLTETTADGWRVRRRAKQTRPEVYLSAAAGDLVSEQRDLAPPDLVFEFALNALRLTQGFARALFTERTGLPWDVIAPRVDAAIADGLLESRGELVRPTALGRDFLDDLVSRFAD